MPLRRLAVQARSVPAIPAVLLMSAFAALSCSSSDGGPAAPVVTTGGIDVAVATTGPDLPTSYMVALDGGTPQSIDANGSASFATLGAGSHSVALSGAPQNCTVGGTNPRTTTVTAGQTASVSFAVTCVALEGELDVTTETTGADLDPDGYEISIDGGAGQAVGVNATLAGQVLAVGDHDIELTGEAANCLVTGENPRSVAIAFDETAATTFEIVCAATTADLRVTANSTGTPLDPDGYTVSVDGGTAQTLGVNGDTVTFAAVAEGNRSVLLANIAAGCTVTGSNPLTTPVPASGEALAVFDVACTTDTGAIELTTVTTGLDTDPDGYTISIDGGTGQAIGNSETVVFDGLLTGSHSLELANLAANCAVQGANPETAAVAAADTTDVTMTVDCAEIPNVLPTVTISSPDTTNSVAPLTVAPGTPVTFTGAASDVEDGALTGTSLVWTSNVDGQFGTGETFVTSALSEGQHTVTLTATDSEGGEASETVLVVLVSAPEPGYQIKLRLAEGVTLTPAQQIAIDSALDKLEAIVTGDLPDIPLLFPAGNCAADIPPTDELVDDLLLYLSVAPIDGQGGTLGFAAPCVFRSVGSLPILGGMRFDSADLDLLGTFGLMDDVLMHEAMHAMGFGTIWEDLGLLHEKSDPNFGGTPGNDTYFDGTQALAQFAVLVEGSYTGNIVPVENDNANFGSGSLDAHWREGVFASELMTPEVDPGANPLSVLTVGQFEDLGYTVDLGAADPYTQVFTLRAPGAAEGPVFDLGNDIYRGPVWMVSPTGAVRRLR